MGRCKQLLPLEGKTVLARALGFLIHGGIGDIIAVVAPAGDAVAEAAATFPVTVVRAPDPEGDMAASARTGRDALSPAATGVLVLPCDHPLVDPVTVRLLAALHACEPEAVLIPVHSGRGGHPTLFPRSLLDQLEGTVTLRDLVRSGSSPVRRVDLSDPGVVLDMDTPEDYRQLVEFCRPR